MVQDSSADHLIEFLLQGRNSLNAELMDLKITEAIILLERLRISKTILTIINPIHEGIWLFQDDPRRLGRFAPSYNNCLACCVGSI